MKLKKVIIHKYKSFESDQEFELDNNITILVGMNESGKTSILESIAKTNYFQNDCQFKYNLTHDYPRREKKKVERSGKNPQAVTCTYEITEKIWQDILKDIGNDILATNEFSLTTMYDNKEKIFSGISVNKQRFIKQKTEQFSISSNHINEKLENVKTSAEYEEFTSTFNDENHKIAFRKLKKYFAYDADNIIGEYIIKTYLKDNLPKFLYYDEYYSLPSRISIEKLENNQLTDSEYKTAKALFELADINTTKLLEADDFEDCIAELEEIDRIISEELFKYWQTNKNLQISFKIDKVKDSTGKIAEHVLDIRVRGKRVSLPLKNRSKGFNWFFSFLVWFKKIQGDTNSNYILLLDEPGLNLHASAQADLMRFLEDLSKEYQIIYTTHSPFMISSENLSRVRTVLETDKGSVISDSIQEKDPNTLFPLQAALGYDIAQNLFISKKNLLVEGVSDLTALTAISSILEEENRESLREDITIVPTGGLEKVATFISLLRGSELEIVCLLDSYRDAKGKAKMNKMIEGKLIQKSKVRFFDEFLDAYSQADLEDLFAKSDYLKLFNSAFHEIEDIKQEDLNPSIKQVIIQLNKHINKKRFNHFRPINEMVKIGAKKSYFEEESLNNFEKVFKKINELFNS